MKLQMLKLRKCVFLFYILAVFRIVVSQIVSVRCGQLANWQRALPRFAEDAAGSYPARLCRNTVYVLDLCIIKITVEYSTK